MKTTIKTIIAITFDGVTRSITFLAVVAPYLILVTIIIIIDITFDATIGYMESFLWIFGQGQSNSKPGIRWGLQCTE